MTRAVVFAYSEVGYRCLEVLADAGVDVAWVVTHRDDPGETPWYRSVAELAARRGLRTSLYETLSNIECLRTLRELAPEFLFSFYFRRMLAAPLLATATRGALNMHGSLLPQYRGRAPINWAIIHGESRTGASLHYMIEKPDAGDLVDQEAVRIGVDDTALDVSIKVAAAAATVLKRSLPGLIAGTAPRRPQNLELGSYFAGRTPADGRIDFSRSAWEIHNLIRALAPPFPGAFADLTAGRLMLLGSHWCDEPAAVPGAAPRLYASNRRLYLDCVDGRRLQITRAELAGAALDPDALPDDGAQLRLGTPPLRARAHT
jgi:methionyl-tRNA formyltransferase